MSIIHEIQKMLLSNNSQLGNALLNFRYIASKLDSSILEDWVKFESEGYPKGANLPEYRLIPVSYKGTFLGAMGGGYTNMPIPSALIKKYAGEKFLKMELNQSIGSIEKLIQETKNEGIVTLSGGDLPLLLRKKVYPDYECNQVVGEASIFMFYEVINKVTHKLLELTMKLENDFPEVVNIEIGVGYSQNNHESKNEIDTMAKQIIYGNQTIINNSGNSNTFTFFTYENGKIDFVKELVMHGIPSEDAEQLKTIIDEEKPGSENSGLGEKAKKWLADNIGKAVSGVWKISTDIAVPLITAAIKQYYGMK